MKVLKGDGLTVYYDVYGQEQEIDIEFYETEDGVEVITPDEFLCLYDKTPWRPFSCNLQWQPSMTAALKGLYECEEALEYAEDAACKEVLDEFDKLGQKDYGADAKVKKKTIEEFNKLSEKEYKSIILVKYHRNSWIDGSIIYGLPAE